MIEVSQRIARLRERALDWQQSRKDSIGQRLYWSLRGLISAEPGLPLMKLKSHMLADVIGHAEPVIHEDEEIVGYHYYGEEWPELSQGFTAPEDRDRMHDYLKEGRLDDEQIGFALYTLEHIRELLPEGRYMPEQPGEAEAATRDGVFWAGGTPANHTVIGYDRVLEMGFAGIRDELRAMLDALSWSDPDGPRKRMVLESLLMVADAACTLGLRYRERVLRLMESQADPDAAARYQRMAQTLARTPMEGARTFREAVQSLWFAHIVNCWEDGINANSLGRLDQILYPYYRADMEAGRLTRDEAFDILCELWIKLYRDYDVQQVMLGGVDSAGRDAANELTYLMLDVTDALDFIRCLSVRLHRSSPRALIRRSLELVAKGQGVPFFFNDDAIIPALTGNGVKLEDARDYAAIGCIEITIPGKANPHAVSNRVNLLKCLELAMNDGVSMTTGERIGPRTGDPRQWTDMEQVVAAYERQAEYFIEMACSESNRLELRHSLTMPMPYKSMLTEGCAGSGLDFNAGGALYNYHESMAMGIPNVADSLAAIGQLVFEEGKYTLGEFIDMLESDYPDERARMEILRRAPKYGNDDDGADRYAARVMEHFCRVVGRQRGVLKGGFFAQPFTYLWLIEAGSRTAATPDGRRQGENLAYSLSPMQGRDFKGLSALMNSLSKLPHHLAAGSTSAIIEVDPLLFGDDSIDMMTALMQTAIERGVGQVQFNVANEETLRKAQADPGLYRNLTVRVSGFSQRFCLLNRELQDHIIARTKHRSA